MTCGRFYYLRLLWFTFWGNREERRTLCPILFRAFLRGKFPEDPTPVVANHELPEPEPPQPEAPIHNCRQQIATEDLAIGLALVACEKEVRAHEKMPSAENWAAFIAAARREYPLAKARIDATFAAPRTVLIDDGRADRILEGARAELARVKTQPEVAR